MERSGRLFSTIFILILLLERGQWLLRGRQTRTRQRMRSHRRFVSLRAINTAVFAFGQAIVQLHAKKRDLWEANVLASG
ncbi:hypothetical protein ACFX13_009012 [Malus domestica]